MDIVFLLVGLLFALVGAYMVWEHLGFRKSARSVPGTVVAMEKRTTPEDASRKRGGPIYYPVIEYHAEGKTGTFTSRYGMSLPPYEIGERVDVLYSRKHNSARIQNTAPYIAGGIFTIIGIVLCIVFFNIFDWSMWAMGTSLLVLAGITYSLLRKARKHDVNTLDELLEAFRNTNMKTSRGTDPEHIERIESLESLQTDLYQRSNSMKWLGPLLSVVGVGLVVLGLYLGKQRAVFLDSAMSTTGEVVKLNSRSTDDGYVYYPVVRFTAPQTGRSVTFEHESGSRPPSYRVGEQVTVLYLPDRPERAIIDGGIMNWFGSGLSLLLGLVLATGGIYSYLHWSRLRKAVVLHDTRE